MFTESIKFRCSGCGKDLTRDVENYFNQSIRAEPFRGNVNRFHEVVMQLVFKEISDGQEKATERETEFVQVKCLEVMKLALCRPTLCPECAGVRNTRSDKQQERRGRLVVIEGGKKDHGAGEPS